MKTMSVWWSMETGRSFQFPKTKKTRKQADVQVKTAEMEEPAMNLMSNSIPTTTSLTMEVPKTTEENLKEPITKFTSKTPMGMPTKAPKPRPKDMEARFLTKKLTPRM